MAQLQQEKKPGFCTWDWGITRFKKNIDFSVFIYIF